MHHPTQSARAWDLGGEPLLQRINGRGLLVSAGAAGLVVSADAAATLAPASGEIQVNTNSDNNYTGSRRAQSVAVAPDGDFVVVWNRGAYAPYAPSEFDALARLFDRSGTPLTGEIFVGEGRDPSVAVDGAGNFVVGWEAPYGDDVNTSVVVMRLFDADGTPTTGVIPVETFTPGGSYGSYSGDIDVARAPDGRIVAVWERCCENFDSVNLIMVRTFDASGTPTSGPIQANTGASSGDGSADEPAVGIDEDGDFAASWEFFDPLEPDNDEDHLILFRSFAADGTPIGAEQLVAAVPNNADPTIGMARTGHFAVGWDAQREGNYYTKDVFMRVYNPGGVPRTGEILVDAVSDGNVGFYSGFGDDVSIATESGKVAITWQSNADGDPETNSFSLSNVFFREYSLDGIPASSRRRVNIAVEGAQNDPSVGMAADGDLVAVAWESSAPPPATERQQDVFVRTFEAAPQATTEPAPIPILNRISLWLLAAAGWLLGWVGFRRRRTG